MTIDTKKLRDLALEKAIPYRPSIAKITGSVHSAILLTQIMYWCDKSRKGEFYKFAKPCSHKQYSAGDSFCEELGFTISEFNSACKKLTDPRIINKRVTMDRRTFYSVNFDEIDRLLASAYLNHDSWFTYKNLRKLTFTKIDNPDLHKLGILTYINYKSWFCSYTENNAESNTENNKKASDPAVAESKGLVSFWMETMKIKSGEKRQKTLAALTIRQLKHFDVETLKNAIIGCSKSAFHMGDNEQRKKYNSLELIFKNAEKIETFADLAITSSRKYSSKHSGFADRGNFGINKDGSF